MKAIDRIIKTIEEGVDKYSRSQFEKIMFHIGKWVIVLAMIFEKRLFETVKAETNGPVWFAINVMFVICGIFVAIDIYKGIKKLTRNLRKQSTEES